MDVTVKSLLGQSVRLEPVSDTPLLDTQLLLAHSLACSRASLLAAGERAVSDRQQSAFARHMKRRERGEPLAYVLGSKGFWDFELVTDSRALVPRPETELLVEKALACLAGREQETLHLLDLGTGTGAVALALARASDRWRVTATDVEADALVLAQDNAARLGVGNVSFLQSDWFASLGAERFDLVASNPPYIAPGDPHLQREGLPFEPRRALVADENGFAALGAIAGAAGAFLRPGGWLLLEHGFTQGASVRELLLGAGFGDLRCWQDLAGLDRVTQARAHR